MLNPSPVGIIGLGQIGSGMAARLAGLDQAVAGFDISAEANARATEMGVHIVTSIAELTERCDTILTSLSSISAIESTYLGPGGLAALHRPSLLTLECSTVPADVARRITKAMIDSGAMAIEASVIGQNREARAGNLFFVVSGDNTSVAHAQTVLGLLGHGMVHIGPSGTAAAAKLINNAIGAVTIGAIAEAIALAGDLGIDPQAFVRLVNEGKGAGSSVVFERYAAHMANWRDSQRPPGPIALKDAQGLAALMGNRRAVLPFLAEMVAQYEAVLPNAAHPQAETITEHACAAWRFGLSARRSRMTQSANLPIGMAEEHPANYLGSCNNPIAKSPNIDHLAEHVACSTNAYSIAPENLGLHPINNIRRPAAAHLELCWRPMDQHGGRDTILVKGHAGGGTPAPANAVAAA